MATPQLVRATPQEEVTLPNPRPQWQGCPTAEIGLGQYDDGRWAYRASAMLNDAGFASPMSHWTDHPSNRFASRDEAMAAAVERVREWVGGQRNTDNPDLRRITEWLFGLRHQQRDLFA